MDDGGAASRRAARRKADSIIAGIIDDAGDLVSGLALEPAGEDGHALANRLWKVAGYLRSRASAPHPYCTGHGQPLEWCRHGD